LNKKLVVIKGIKEVLEQLETPICVASGSTPERLKHTLEITDLYKFFNSENIFSSIYVKNGKPAPDIFLHAAQKMGVAPKDCIVIEDSFNGVKAGKAANMTVLGFFGGSHCYEGYEKRLKESGADKTFNSMSQLIKMIKEA
jgi:HAD superfamily hydrolase (TIGR01509 family)